MPITELDLYKSGWLELVFDDRNKEYGAYDLRKHYAENLFKALGFTTLGFVCLLLGFNFVLTHQPKPDMAVEVNLSKQIKIPDEQIRKPVEPPKPPKADPPQVKTVKFPPPVVAPDKLAENPPKVDEAMLSVISTKKQDGVAGVDPGPAISDNTAINPATEDNEIKTIGTVEVNPEFPGGMAAWTKFMQKNLRYPNQAIEAGVGGKVFVTFVVEKDGHLSDIKIVRSVGYGLDEEAVRVLKLAPAWKPGIQNGRPVRVMYTMPFSFQLPDNN